MSTVWHGSRCLGAVLTVLALTVCAPAGEGRPGSVAAEWSRFRGPNGSGRATAVGIPSRMGPGDHEVWRVALPPGHSSPIVAGDAIYLTAIDDDTLYTYALDRATGEIAWRRPAPRPRRESLNLLNNAASPTPAADDTGVYVFFGDFGLIAYDLDGGERWRLPLGPFDNAYGMASSPIVFDGQVIQVCDQKSGSFMVAVGADDGQVRWRVERPGSGTGHSTPVLWRDPDGATQILVPGSFRLAGYDPTSGERRWWVAGLAFEMKAVPVLSPDDATVYINGTSATAFEDSYDRAIPAYDEVASHDLDGDGRFQRDEIPDDLARRWLGLIDLDGDGGLDRTEWEWYRTARASRGGINAFRLGGTGDMTEQNFLWNHDRSVPQLPSALLYEGVLYMVNDGGIVTLLDPASGEVLDRGRLTKSVDRYFASPVAADHKIFMLSERCLLTVLRPGNELDVLVVNDLDDICFATPAFDANRIYVRTQSHLWAFSESAAAAAESSP